jgi:hypothetical protein
MSFVTQTTLDEALHRASEEEGLDEWYRDCVRPLLRSGEDGFPRCCGGGCEPCSEQLIRVARRTFALLGIDAREGVTVTPSAT